MLQYRFVKGKNDMKWIFPPVCPLKGHELWHLSGKSTPSVQVLGSNITAHRKEPGVLRKMAVRITVGHLVHKSNDSTVASLNRLLLTKSGTI